MDMALGWAKLDDVEQINNIVSAYKLTNIEKVLANLLDDFSNSSAVDYIGQLNKTDTLF